MNKSDLDGWVSTRTSTEKLYDIFLERYRLLWDGSGMRERDVEQMWWEFLDGTGGVEHIRKFSDMAEATDYLLERVNDPEWSRLVIRDPCGTKSYIVLDRDFAERALVLGSLPSITHPLKRVGL